ncbi:MAG: SIR2 family protein [Romboutsia timonensis]|uniref:SIR2 family protein n=1 Tax=Romboutsia timonensis TaxID=1776391 RepID=UPI002A751939|nr:SIR2 family protein [Romboutsia timonensis]MDY2883402.1 SIR2 family protein [Romboutsia timonensis]
MKEQIYNHISKFDTTPFLFVGSGLTRRYLGLDSWYDLLNRFAVQVEDNDFAFEIYTDKAEDMGYSQGQYQKIAELIEKDFNRLWYRDEKYRLSREKYKDEVKINKTSPFKIEIADYIKSSGVLVDEYKEEIELFKKISERSISGAITTNYDTFLEDCFEGYEKYIGQEELLFSPIQGSGEIYKIHGCCDKPKSIIINEEDYKDFEEKNAYLASKILTIFLEHPIIFIGYSISDINIQNILKSIIKCLSQDNLEKLKNRLIFIEWNNGEDEDSISQFSKDFGDGKSLEMTKIKLKDYSLLYKALIENKSKYRTNLLRNLKKDVYDLVLTNKPGTKMKVVGLEDDDKLDEVEVVIGVGVLSEFGKRGYSSIKPNEIYEDIVFDNRDLDPRLVVEECLPSLLKFHGNSIPINKYVSQYDGELSEQIKKEIKTEFKQLLNNTIEKEKARGRIKESTISELIEKYDDLRCLEYIPLLDLENIDMEELKEFLVEFMINRPNFLDTDIKSIHKTNFRRVIKIYDWIKYYYNN